MNYTTILYVCGMLLLSGWLPAQTVTDSLQHYLEVAAQNNPGVKADFLSYKAALQKVPQAGAYSDPQLEMGFFLKPMEVVDGKQIAEFKLMQMFPWFGTRKAARTEAAHMAQMTFEKFRESRDNLFLNVYTEWFLLCKLQQQLVNYQENKALLTQLEALSVRKFAAPATGRSSGRETVRSSATTSGTSMAATQSMGGTSGGMGGMASMGGSGAAESVSSSANGSMAMGAGMAGGSMSSGMGDEGSGLSNVLRIQMEIAEVDNGIESLLSEISARKAVFNSLLNRPATMEVAVPDSIDMLPFAFDDEGALQQMERQNPMLSMIEEETKAYRAKGEMDRKMSYPMFGIGLQYMLVEKSNASGSTMDSGASGMSSMNGMDMVMPMVSVSIPIFRGKYKAQQRESRLLQESGKEKYAATLNALQAGFYETKHQLEDAIRKIGLYRKQEQLAQTTYQLTVKELISGKGDLTNVIQVQRQLLDYQLKKAEATADYNTQVARMQKLLSYGDIEK